MAKTPEDKTSKPATAAGKSSTKSRGDSKRGGARPGAGRKPKAITELKAALIAAPIQAAEAEAEAKLQALAGPAKTKPEAAEAAWNLFVRTMLDTGQDLELRLDCAKEVLNRTLGKPRQAVELSGPEGDSTVKVHIFLPDNGRQTKTA